MRDPIIGIDLGTSNTVVAHVDATGQPVVLADSNKFKIHPSVVSFHPNGGVVIGAAAKQRKVIDPQNTIYSVKRLIGRSFRSPEVATAMARSPFLIKEGENHAPVIVTRAGEFAVPEISAILLDYVRNIAIEHLRTVSLNRAVVTVPASFNDAQRSATATAGAIANLEVVRVLNEPTAAALAYGHTRNLREIIAVYDFGGGTFDITILKLEDQVYEVLGTAGDTFLGGDDLDERIVDKMVAKFLVENRVDLRTNEIAMMRLRAVAEQTKIELSRRARALVRIDEIAYGARGKPLNLNIEITRDEFVSQVADIIDRTFPVCQEALALAGIGVDQIADVILVGGTTKIPYVRDQVSKFFAKAPRTDVNPEDAVAIGASLQAAALEQALGASDAEEDTKDASASDVARMVDASSGPMQVPSELATGAPRPRRATAGYQAKPDTSYVVTRSVPKDVYESRTPPPASPPAIPLARMTKSMPIPTVPADPRTTVPGVAPRRATPPPLPSTQPTARGQPVQRPPADIPTESQTAPGRETETFPGLAPPTGASHRAAAFADSPPSFSDGDQLPSGGDSYTDADAVMPQPGFSDRMSQASASFSDEDQLGRAASQTNPFEKEETETREAPVLPPANRPVPAAPPNARTMIAAPPSQAPRSGEIARPVVPAADPARRWDSEFTNDRAASTAKGFQPPEAPFEIAAAPTATAFPPAPFPPAASYPQTPQQYPMTGHQPAAPPAAMPTLMPAAIAAPVRPPILLEVTPRGLGISTVAGFCEELIRRNSRLPAAMKKLFTTSRERQELVRIVVVQGESRRMDHNTIIGDLILANLPPRSRGETSIEVTFSLDASGILQVNARDAETGAEQSATLDLVGGIAQQDVAASRDRIAALRR